MRSKHRDDGPTPFGNAYAITDWDDETGDGDIQEFNEDDDLVCRHEWRLDETGRGTGEMVTLDASGKELSRRPIEPGRPVPSQYPRGRRAPPRSHRFRGHAPGPWCWSLRTRGARERSGRRRPRSAYDYKAEIPSRPFPNLLPGGPTPRRQYARHNPLRVTLYRAATEGEPRLTRSEPPHAGAWCSRHVAFADSAESVAAFAWKR
jgi:hypothetical protein